MTEPRTALSATEAALKNAKALSHLNAFISIDESVSLQQAQAIDSLPQEEKAKKPLLGLPIAIKDNINTAAFATSGGTPTLKDWRPKQDAPIVQQLLDAGTVIVGKANMHELALGITSNNATFGPARNPYDPTRVAGGSSGGTAVAVSARIVPVGIGTDTGGSGRIPAAMCGCIGFRPTLGRYRCDGVLPLSSTRDTPTLMALTMDHILLLDSVLSSSSSSCSSSSSSASSLRIGLPKNYYWDGIDEEVKQVIEQAIQKIDSALTQKAKDAKTESSGVIPVELVEEGQQMDQLNKATYPIIFYEMGRETAAYLYLHGCDKVSSVRELWEGMAAPDEKGLLMAQLDPITATTAEQYREAMLKHRPALQSLFQSYFDSNNLTAMLTPTIQSTSCPIDNPSQTTFETFFHYIRNPEPASNAGVPCITLPVGLTKTRGLPVGIELTARAGDDARLLSLATEIAALFEPLPPPSFSLQIK